jgi:hypothetical protein
MALKKGKNYFCQQSALWSKKWQRGYGSSDMSSALTFRRSVHSNVSVMWFRRSVHPILKSSAVPSSALASSAVVSTAVPSSAAASYTQHVDKPVPIADAGFHDINAESRSYWVLYKGLNSEQFVIMGRSWEDLSIDCCNCHSWSSPYVKHVIAGIIEWHNNYTTLNDYTNFLCLQLTLDVQNSVVPTKK